MAMNSFLAINRKVLDELKKEMFLYHQKGSYGGALPLNHMIELYNGLEREITILQADKENLVLKVQELEGEIGTLTKKISGGV